MPIIATFPDVGWAQTCRNITDGCLVFDALLLLQAWLGSVAGHGFVPSRDRDAVVYTIEWSRYDTFLISITSDGQPGAYR